MKKKKEQPPGELPVPDTENRFRLLAEQMNDIVWTTDLELKPTYVSPSIEKVLGFTPEERLQQSLAEKMPPETLRLVEEKVKEELTHDRERDPGRSIIYDLDFYHRDGAIRTLETSLSFIRDQQGSPTGIYGLSRDVTARKRAEEELRESENRFRAVFDRAKDGIFIETPEGKILDVNRAVTDMLGYTREELLKLRVGALVPPEIAAQLPPAIRPETVAEGAYIETENVRKDGTRIPVEVGNSLVEIGGEERVIAIVRDITERKRAERDLQEIGARLRAAIDADLDSFFIFRCLRDQSGRIEDFIFVDLNRRAEEMLQMKREDLIGKRMCEILPVNRELGFLEKYKKVVETGVPVEEEFYLPDTHVPAAWYFHQVVPLDDGIAISHRDITERKQAEEQLRRHVEDLRARNTALTRFNAVMTDREVRMIELKREVNELCLKLGEPPRHKIVAVPSSSDAPAEDRK
jgi:PAS domain S-box-containing protein